MIAHRGRLCRVMSVSQRQHRGHLVGLRRPGCSDTLWVTPDSLVATPLPALPPFGAGIDTARRLRRKSTPSEAELWRSLRERGIAHKFRRQHPLGPFILDFFCPALRLAIELDGGIHAMVDQAAYDRSRQELIEGYSVEFVRLSSGDVDNRLSEAVTRIAVVASERAAQVCYDLRWVVAGELVVGDSVLFGPDRKETVIEKIMADETTQPIYDVAVEKEGSYITEVCILRGFANDPFIPSPRAASPLSRLGEGNKG